MATASQGGDRTGTKNRSQSLHLDIHYTETFSIDEMSLEVFSVDKNEYKLTLGRAWYLLNGAGIKTLKKLIDDSADKMQMAFKENEDFQKSIRGAKLKL